MILSKWDGVRVNSEEAQTIVNIAEAVGLKRMSTHTHTYCAIFYNGEVLEGCGEEANKIHWLTFKQFINKMVTKTPKFRHGQKFVDCWGDVWTLKQNPCHNWNLESSPKGGIHFEGHEMTLDQVRAIRSELRLIPVN